MATEMTRGWASVAPSWERYAEFLEARAAELTARMVAAVAPRPGDRVLELACGAGGAGLATAELVAPSGEVVLSDVVEEMTAIAARRAKQRGLSNVTTRRLDLDGIDEPSESYDIVLCREGLMFAADPAASVAEIRRVLRPDGRYAVSVWAAPAANPWLSIVFALVAPPGAAPAVGPFALADRARFTELFRAAGLSTVDVDEIAVPLRETSFEAWWDRTAAMAGPLQAAMRTLSPEAITAMRDTLRERSAPYRVGVGLEFPGLTLLAAGQR